MYKVLIVENDTRTASLFRERLERWGFDCCFCSDFSRILDEFLAVKPHIVLLDIVQPFFNGFYWCAEIRKVTKTPVILVSSHTESMDIIMAVNMGADDYITVPFSGNILIKKIDSVLANAYGVTELSKPLPNARDAVFNPEKGIILFGDTELELNRRELTLLGELFARKNDFIPKKELARSVFDSDDLLRSGALSACVGKLNARLAEIGLDSFIEAKRGVGYRISE